MKISCYNCFWCANVWSIYVCEHTLHRCYPYIFSERCLNPEFLPYQNGASQACDRIKMRWEPAVVPPASWHLSWGHPRIARLWAAQTAASVTRVKGDIAIVINKHRKVIRREKPPLLSPKLPWLAGERWQDSVLEQTQLLWAPGRGGCGATELIALLMVTWWGPSLLRQVNLNSI